MNFLRLLRRIPPFLAFLGIPLVAVVCFMAFMMKGYYDSFETAVDSIRIHEGFQGFPYGDTDGNRTIGYGTLLPLTPDESEELLRSRLQDKISGILRDEPAVRRLPVPARAVVYEMAYQLGVEGAEEFRAMFAALERGDCRAAMREALDSRWGRRFPIRAREEALKLLDCQE